MKISIDEDIIKRTVTDDGKKLSLEEFLGCLLVQLSDNAKYTIDNLIDKGFVKSEKTIFGERITVTQKTSNLIRKIILLSDNSIPQDEELIPLAKSLKEVYPKGRKPNTNTYWQEAVTPTVERLKVLYKSFPEIKEYSHEQIIQAATEYVHLWDNDPNKTYMRTLNYFLWKKDDVLSSDLLKVLENLGNNTLEIFDSSEIM